MPGQPPGSAGARFSTLWKYFFHTVENFSAQKPAAPDVSECKTVNWERSRKKVE